MCTPNDHWNWGTCKCGPCPMHPYIYEPPTMNWTLPFEYQPKHRKEGPAQ